MKVSSKSYEEFNKTLSEYFKKIDIIHLHKGELVMHFREDYEPTQDDEEMYLKTQAVFQMGCEESSSTELEIFDEFMLLMVRAGFVDMNKTLIRTDEYVCKGTIDDEDFQFSKELH